MADLVARWRCVDLKGVVARRFGATFSSRSGRLGMVVQDVVASWAGFCPICLRSTRFTARNSWFRDHLLCETCEGGSIPRERALMFVLRQLLLHWETLDIHESSPAPRGVSKLLSSVARGYVATQFWPNIPLGTLYRGIRCENLEDQTFPPNSFDLVITQDVMEHVFHPERAYQEIYLVHYVQGGTTFTLRLFTSTSCTQSGRLHQGKTDRLRTWQSRNTMATQLVGRIRW